MKKVILSVVLALASIAHAAPADVFKRLDKQPLRSATPTENKPLSAAYALCGVGSDTTMYRITRTSVRGTGNIRYTDHIYLHLFNGDMVSVSRSDCKFFYVK